MRRVFVWMGALWKRKGRRRRGLPSLVQAISQVSSKRVMREVIASSYDRRQWGVLAAAWVGISERQFARRAAEVLGLEYQERVMASDLSCLGEEAHAVLAALERIGAIALVEDGKVSGYVAVDPAEVEGLPFYRGDESVAIASWSDISRALEETQRLVASADSHADTEAAQARDGLCKRIFEILLNEARAHGATSLEVISTSTKGQYQFVASSGHVATGQIHPGALPDLVTYLCSQPSNVLHSARVGPVVIRLVHGSGHIRLAWGREAFASGDREVPEVAGEVHRLPPPNETPEHVSGAENASRRPSVLVVDDNFMFGRVLEKLLIREGFEPAFAPNGAEAYTHLIECSNYLPHVIVCDLHMPVMNGKEFLARLKGDPRFRNIPVIMLTSDEDIEAEVGLLEAGADAFVPKAKDPRILCAQIRRMARATPLREAA